MYQRKDIQKGQKLSLPKVNYEELSAAEIIDMPRVVSEKISGEIRKNVTTRLFAELDEHGEKISKHIPLLEKHLGSSFISAAKRRKISHSSEPERLEKTHARLFIRDIAININQNPSIIQKCPKLRKKIKDELIEAANNYFTCRAAIMKLNEPLVTDYINNHHFIKTSEFVRDFEQAAKIGLMTAVDRFLPQVGSAFPSYAITCIKTRIEDEKRKISIVTVPEVSLRKEYELQKTVNQEIAETGNFKLGELPNQLLCQETPPAFYHLDTLSHDKTFRAETKKRDAYRGLEAIDLSYSPLGEAMANEERTGKELFREKDLPNLLETLTPKELLVITEFYGLSDSSQPCKTLEEIGKSFTPPVTRERIHQIKVRALEKIREKLEKTRGLKGKVEALFLHE